MSGGQDRGDGTVDSAASPTEQLIEMFVDLVQKGRIKGHRHAHRRTAVSGIGGALKEEPRRGNIPGSKKAVAAGHESGDLVGG